MMGQEFREFAFTRKQIRKALVLLFKKFCKRYCRGMGFCGKHCSRGREDFDFLGAADDIAASEFFYRSSDANVSVLRNLLNLFRGYHSLSWKWGDDINEHWLHDVLRRYPPSEA